MNYTKRFQDLKKLDINPVIPFLMIGDPDLETSIMRIESLAQLPLAGFELGLPFTDPVFDGPILQKAHERALGSKFNLGRLQEALVRIRQAAKDIPIGLMSSLNPFYQMDASFRSAMFASVDSVLFPELPIRPVPALEMAVPSSKEVLFLGPVKRQETYQREVELKLASFAGAYIYLAGYAGITGQSKISDLLPETLRWIKSHTKVPVAVGFGIKDRASAHIALEYGAEAVIIGSALVETYEKGSDAQAWLASILGCS